MSSPIRQSVHVAGAFPKEASEMTLRDALEWYKRILVGFTGDMLNGLEQKYVNERWVVLCSAIGEREGVPTGSLSYYLAELAQAERQLAETAEAESQAAQMLNP